MTTVRLNKKTWEHWFTDVYDTLLAETGKDQPLNIGIEIVKEKHVYLLIRNSNLDANAEFVDSLVAKFAERAGLEIQHVPTPELPPFRSEHLPMPQVPLSLFSFTRVYLMEIEAKNIEEGEFGFEGPPRNLDDTPICGFAMVNYPEDFD